MKEISREIKRLLCYGLQKGLIKKEDEVYLRNRLLDVLQLDDYVDVDLEQESFDHPQEIVDNIIDYAFNKGLIKLNNATYRDLLESKIMDCLIPRPSDVINKFYNDYDISPRLATENYYELSKNSNYIKTQRINKNLVWKAQTNYGELDITINLSKPEKDPKMIAALRNIKSSSYPKCLLCKENEGYAGRINHPGRHNHRVIPIKLDSEKWFLQYSPYVYYNEHCIVFKNEHEPMTISETTFKRLLSFVELFPHYFIGSNADLPIVGGSILSHEHFQGGHYTFAMENAKDYKLYKVREFEDIEVSIVKWPLSVIRLRCKYKDRVVKLAGYILRKWREYDDETVEIKSYTDDTPHNTITPIARFKNNMFELDLVLRNNRTTEEYPLGLFHPHEDVHHIKKENIGLIEVMGLAVLPSRLKQEINLISECLLDKCGLEEYNEFNKHAMWIKELKEKYKLFTEDNIISILQSEIGNKFERVLEDAGVFKHNSNGLLAFEKFIKFL